MLPVVQTAGRKRGKENLKLTFTGRQKNDVYAIFIILCLLHS
jgi:hypothetical protein